MFSYMVRACNRLYILISTNLPNTHGEVVKAL